MTEWTYNYVEKDCKVEHEGHTFESGGAVVTPDWIIAYIGEDGILTDWHGKFLGVYKIVASWPTPRSFISSKQYQIEACVGGVHYTGRSGGVGLIYKGKRIKDQKRVK